MRFVIWRARNRARHLSKFNTGVIRAIYVSDTGARICVGRFKDGKELERADD